MDLQLMLVFGELKMLCFSSVTVEWKYLYKENLGHVLHFASYN